MSKKIVTLAVAAGMLACLVWAAGPAQAQSGGGCQLKGTASFHQPLTNNSAPFTYDFGGQLASCQSNQQGAPGSGGVSAGRTLPFNGEAFQEPTPSGNGSCGSGTTHGFAIAKWAGGSYTVIKYQTQSAAAAVQLQGTVAPSLTLKAIHPKPGQPKYHTVKTTMYAGARALGVLTFTPSDPQDCSGTGVHSAPINGFTGLGNQ